MKILEVINDNEVRELNLNSFIFPGGEVGVKIIRKSFCSLKRLKISASFKDSASFLEFVMYINAIRENFGHDSIIDAYIGYYPYTRQDRVCNKGEAFSVKAFSQLVNSLKLNTITVVDPHSDVTAATLDNCNVISQETLVSKFLSLNNRILTGNVTIVSPDAGSNKKTYNLAKYFNHEKFIRADKLRNLQTGDIIASEVFIDNFNGSDVVVFDDICDGGRTFIELAATCKKKGCGKFILYVTHGIFSKGLDVLFNNGIDEIYTTNSYYNGSDSRVKILNLEEIYNNQ